MHITRTAYGPGIAEPLGDRINRLDDVRVGGCLGGRGAVRSEGTRGQDGPRPRAPVLGREVLPCVLSYRWKSPKASPWNPC